MPSFAKNKVSASNLLSSWFSDLRGSHENGEKPPSQIVLLGMAAIVAGTGVLTANWIVARFKISANFMGSALFCVAWIALYPAVRRNKSTPGALHWMRGVFILIMLWLAITASR